MAVFEVFNKAGGAHYTDEDVFIVEALALTATTALQNDMLENNALSSQNELRQPLIRSKRIDPRSHHLA